MKSGAGLCSPAWWCFREEVIFNPRVRSPQEWQTQMWRGSRGGRDNKRLDCALFLESSSPAAADTGVRLHFIGALRGNNVLSELTLLQGCGAAGRSASGVGWRVVDIDSLCMLTPPVNSPASQIFSNIPSNTRLAATHKQQEFHSGKPP